MTKRATLTLLALLFFGPMIVAWIWFFYFQDVRPGTVNQGELVEPPVDISMLELRAQESGHAETPFEGDWSVVLLAPRECSAECEHALWVTRQVWIRLNRDADRVQRVLLLGPDVNYPVEEHRDLRVFDMDDAARGYFEAENDIALAGAERVYLVDPFGNIMMSYPLDLEPEMLSKDLKRLLRISEADKND